MACRDAKQDLSVDDLLAGLSPSNPWVVIYCQPMMTRPAYNGWGRQRITLGTKPRLSLGRSVASVGHMGHLKDKSQCPYKNGKITNVFPKEFRTRGLFYVF